MIGMSGLLVTHQCEQFDYCYRESIDSLLGICDEVVVVDGRSTDGTREVLSDYGRAIRVIDADWTPEPGTNGRWLSDLYNLAKSHSSGLWNIGLQADEVLHEMDREVIRGWYRNTSLRRINFWRDTKHFVPMGKTCGSQVSRFGSHANFIGDAECRETTVTWHESSVCIFHYGFLRRTESLIAKGISLETEVFGNHNPLFERMESEGRKPFDDYHDTLEDYTGSHPKFARWWLETRGYDSGIYIAARAISPFIKDDWTGVEIGIWEGDSSLHLLSKCRYMYLIDPCEPYDGNPDATVFAKPEDIRMKLKGSEDRYDFLIGMSHEVLPMIPEVDFVFVDGNHTYEYVSRDVELYWPKVRSGGFISGHDYGFGFPDIIRSVNEFATKVALPLEIHGDCWMIRKP